MKNLQHQKLPGSERTLPAEAQLLGRWHRPAEASFRPAAVVFQTYSAIQVATLYGFPVRTNGASAWADHIVSQSPHLGLVLTH